jgi:hypothetical protein
VLGAEFRWDQDTNLRWRAEGTGVSKQDDMQSVDMYGAQASSIRFAQSETLFMHASEVASSNVWI